MPELPQRTAKTNRSRLALAVPVACLLALVVGWALAAGAAGLIIAGFAVALMAALAAWRGARTVAAASLVVGLLG
jgi:hypothetical protein